MNPSAPCSPTCGCAAPPALDLAAVRTRLAGSAGDGKKYWRSLEAVTETAEFHEWLHREYPRGASEWPEGQSRRDFLKLMAASFALAGFTACTRQPQETIHPYVKQPEQLVQGVPLQYATAMTLGGYATGLLVESHEGRPTKIEGNPDHPMSLGAANVFHQASVLELYDPDRTRTVLRAGEVSSWPEFMADLVNALAEQRPNQGAGLRLLTETVTSPTLAAQIDALLKKYPQAKWHQYEPWNRDSVQADLGPGTRQAQEIHHDFTGVKVIVALDCDFLFTHPASLAYARQFAKGRDATSENSDPTKGAMSRLYVAEPTPTITGTMADHRLACSAAEVQTLTEALAQMHNAASTASLSKTHQTWLAAAMRDLEANPGAGLVLVGEGQPSWVHQLASMLNHAYKNPVDDNRSFPGRPARQTESLRELTLEMHAGQVDLLVQIGGNAAYNAPVDFGFADAMSKVRRNLHFGLFYNETAQRCQWHLPEAHYLESWGDAQAFDGTLSVMQPLIMPLYEGRTAHELLDMLVLEQTSRGAYDIVRDQWQATHPDGSFEKMWRKLVHDGLTPTSLPPATPIQGPTNVGPNSPPSEIPPGTLEIVFKPDYTVWDGRFANNGWLQETPKPITKLTWDNAALLSPRLAEKLGVANEDVVELTFKGRSVHAPVWIQPGQAENSVTLHLGYGRTAAGTVGSGQGVNAYALRTSEAMGFGTGLEIKKVPGAKWQLATVQQHHSTEGRDVYRVGTLEEYRKKPSLAPENAEVPGPDDTLYPPDHTYPGYAWGMSIDLSTCIGCNACVVACQSENNIPIVGKGEVIRGREMHWIRVDGYYEGDLDNPAMYHEPVPCMHCENAPCEVVCPVAATLHSPEGLNEQVYNRCIGTRYCSNNCPYKVRRFNFVQYPDNTTLTYKMQRNPDVSVRSRGIMEKCTYCVQRINEVKITSQKEDRPVRDGEIKTACQQTCPTEAIVFGDINDPNSRVSKLKKQERNFGMFADLNTRPRTTYLARITNPAT